MTGPSAIGSLNGKPISTRPAPACASAGTARSVAARSGSPAVTNGMKTLRPAARRVWNRVSIGFIRDRETRRQGDKEQESFSPSLPVSLSPCLFPFLLQPGHLFAVLVAAAREADHDGLVVAAPPRLAQRLDHGVGRLQRRQDALQPGAGAEAVQRL